jgi:hypothetical protein
MSGREKIKTATPIVRKRTGDRRTDYQNESGSLSQETGKNAALSNSPLEINPDNGLGSKHR